MNRNVRNFKGCIFFKWLTSHCVLDFFFDDVSELFDCEFHDCNYALLEKRKGAVKTTPVNHSISLSYGS